MLSRTRWEIYTLTPGTKIFILESDKKKLHAFSDRPSSIAFTYLQVFFSSDEVAQTVAVVKNL